MTRRTSRLSMVVALLLGGVSALAGCDKPTEENCRKALTNMQTLLGTEDLNATGFEGEVRRCKGGSSKPAVECAIRAHTLDELRACDFMKVPDKAGAGGKTGGKTDGKTDPTDKK